MENKESSKEEVKVTKLFNKIDLTAVKSKSRTAKPIHNKITKIKVKTSKNYEQGKQLISLETFLETQPNSVKDYINECHDDIKTFIREQQAHSIKSMAGGLIILTRNKFRIEIKTVSINKRSVQITGPKKEKWFYMTESKEVKSLKSNHDKQY